MGAVVRTTTIPTLNDQLANITYTSPTNYGALLGMLSDRATLVASESGSNSHNIGVSGDGGATWTWGHSVGGGSTKAAGIIETPGGEVLVIGQSLVSNATTGLAGYIQRSTGWNKATGDATSWATVLTGEGPGVNFDARWGVTARSVAPSWSARAGAIFLAEYGTHIAEAVAAGNPATWSARRVFMSLDDGITWTVVFDLQDRFPGVTNSLHVHGCAYDPFDDRLLVTTGDGGNGDGGQCAVWYCDGENLAGTPVWTAIPGTQSTGTGPQCTAVAATESGIILLPDAASAGGVRRVGRRGFRRYGDLVDTAPLGAVIGAYLYQNPGQPGAPMLMSYVSTATSGPPSLLATSDGETVREIHREATSITGGAPGFQAVVGPDVNGRIYAHLNLSGTGQLMAADYTAAPTTPASSGGTLTSSRQILTGPGITGGGDLTADRTLTAVGANSAARYGLFGHTMPGHLAGSTSAALTTGTVYVVRVAAEDTAASGARTVRCYQIGAGSGLTLAKAAVFDASGNQLGVSADQSATFNTAGPNTRSVSVGTFALTKGADYYLALVMVGTTGPTLARSSSSGPISVGLAGATLLFATGATGQTDMPATITPASLSGAPFAAWLGLL